ncbi:MAG: hypothetical protein R2838_21210 [Caldilineaceae bacterium]
MLVHEISSSGDGKWIGVLPLHTRQRTYFTRPVCVLSTPAPSEHLFDHCTQKEHPRKSFRQIHHSLPLRNDVNRLFKSEPKLEQTVNVADIQTLSAADLDGWLLYDFRGSNPHARCAWPG